MDTEQKHTPGPWLAFQANSEVGTNYWRIRTAPPESGLLDTIGGYCGEANASLIAAAPDLLEALKAIRMKYGEYACDACDAADAAIAKAEGTTQNQ